VFAVSVAAAIRFKCLWFGIDVDVDVANQVREVCHAFGAPASGYIWVIPSGICTCGAARLSKSGAPAAGYMRVICGGERRVGGGHLKSNNPFLSGGE
jgi:hypothetical protein